MEKHSLSIPDATSVLIWKSAPAPNDTDVRPQVSFDIGLGRIYDNVDFDYKAYQKYLREKGMSDQEIHDLSIHFSRNTVFRQDGGYYVEGKGQIDVATGRMKPASSINKALIHESQHYCDDARKKLGSKWKNTANQMATAAKLGLSATNIGGITTTSILGSIIHNNSSNHELVERLSDCMLYNCYTMLGSLTVSLALFTPYLCLSNERSARQASRKNKNLRIVSLRKKALADIF